MKCIKCQTEIPDNSSYCPHCGAEQSRASESTDNMKKKSAVNNILLAGVIFVAFGIGWFILFGGEKDFHANIKEMPPSAESAMPDMSAQLEELLKKADENPEDADNLVNIGNLYFDSHNFAQALIYYQKSLKLKPDNPDVLIDAGVCFFNIGNLERAKQNFEEALKINPNHPIGLYNLGIVYSNKGDHQKAAELWHKILQVAPESPQAEAIRQMLNSQESSNL